jgi:NAD(P)-dependent dehydrogenase (short-subunit alcohol dehydrogenase family)
MTQTIVVCGYGTGISDAVAKQFGAEGFQVALLARNAERVERGAATLAERGVRARGFACDVGDPAAVTACLARIRSELPAITVLHWNAYARVAGDLTRCDPNELRASLDVAVTGLVAAVQAALPDLQAASGRAAVLVTGGGLSMYDPQMDKLAAKLGAMGLAVAKAAQHKLVGVLHHKLAPLGIYVGEVTVHGLVKGTLADRGQGTLEPSAIAERFWQLYRERRQISTQIS